MRKTKSNFKANVIYGLVVAFPFAITFVILEKVVDTLRRIATFIGLESAFAASIAIVLAVSLFLILFYAIGAFMHTKIGALSFKSLEKKIFMQIPGYEIISNMLKGFAEDKIESYRPALVQLCHPGDSVFCFVMEENDNRTVTVFVPSVPTMTIGNLHVVELDRVTFLEAKHREVINCITDWGVGSNEIIGRAEVKGT
jgi:uncharacterized membrane protein